MAVSTQVVRFQKDSSGTNGVTQDVSLNFTPKAIIIFSDGNTANNTVSAHYQWCQGFSDGTNHACVVLASDDADGAADTSKSHRTDSVFVRLNDTTNENVLSSASCSFGTNKVTFTWDVNNAEATYIILWAIGGDSITNTNVNTVSVGTTSTGNHDYTGLGFTVSAGEGALFTLAAQHQTVHLNTVTGDASLSFGCGVSSTKRWSIANVMENTRDPTDTWRVTSNSNCIYMLKGDDGTIDASADFNAWISDGFRLNITNAFTATDNVFSYLVINGGTWDAGTLTAPTTATNNVDYAVSVSSQTLRGMMLASCGDLTSGSIDAHALVSIGATDGTTTAMISNIDEDAAATTDSYRVNNTVNLSRLMDLAGTSTDIANFDSFTTNNFRLDWPTKSANAQLFPWVVVADQTEAAVTVDIFPYSYGKIHTMFDNNTGPQYLVN